MFYMKVKIVYCDHTSTTVIWPASTTLEYADNFVKDHSLVVDGIEILSFFAGENECWKEAVNA